MKCLETRIRHGMRWRRYRTDDGRTITTYELPTAVLRGAAPAAKLRERLEKWERAEQARAKHQIALQRLADGVKPEAIAHELGYSTRHVQRIRAVMQREM